MIAEVGAAISSIKAAIDIAKGITSLQTEAEINLAVIDVQRALLEAQSGAFEDRQSILQLNQEIRELKTQLHSKQKWEEEKSRYTLTGSERGSYYYDLIPEMANGEVPHKLCSTCFENQKKSILHGIDSGDCHSCKTKIHYRTIKSEATFWL